MPGFTLHRPAPRTLLRETARQLAILCGCLAVGGIGVGLAFLLLIVR